jgi:hypothetical protein
MISFSYYEYDFIDESHKLPKARVSISKIFKNKNFLN